MEHGNDQNQDSSSSSSSGRPGAVNPAEVLAGDPEGTERAADEQLAGDMARTALGAGDDEVREGVEARVQATEAALASQRPDSGDNNGKISSRYIQACLSASEMGDGMLYAAANRSRYTYNATAGEWLVWEENHWSQDVGEESRSGVEYVAEEYGNELKKIAEQLGKVKEPEQFTFLQGLQKRLYKQIQKLRTSRGRQTCLEFAHANIDNPLRVLGDQLDNKSYLLACKNGVINLLTGELRAGRHEDFLTMASPIEWKGLHAPAPAWDKMLLEVMSGDKELVAYLGRLFGYCVSGSTKTHVLPVLWGQGRNGKGTIIETINHVMGPLSSPIPAAMLLDQGKFKSSSGPSPDIMALRGLRLAFASETDQHGRFSTSQVKWLSGADTLTGRWPHDKHPTTFKATHKLILLTNHKPYAPSHDFGFWERLHLVPFMLSFVDREVRAENERKADPDLPETLLDEADGVLAWLVRGCMEWQFRGLDPPPVIKKATAEYQRDQDILIDFIEDCCHMDPKEQVAASSLYDAFQEWWKENISSEEKKIPSQRRFGNLMRERGVDKKKKGTYFYLGIRLLLEWEKKTGEESG